MTDSSAIDTLSEQFDLLGWDSARFGFTVARVHSSTAVGALEDVAEQMRKRGIVLAYFNVPAHFPIISAELLSRLGGRLVDRRITYAAELKSCQTADSELDSGGAGFCITEYRRSTVVPSLARLARESGAFSRFRLDPQIAPGVFEAIYDAWISRSVNHEIADQVLVAKKSRRTVGFVSVKTSGICGEIGLLAVDRTTRGRGIGHKLVREAHSIMVGRGCTQARVATQGANLGACALYEAAGYAVRQVEHVYHLWLSDASRNGLRR